MFTVRFILTKQISADQRDESQGNYPYRRSQQLLSEDSPTYTDEFFKLGIPVLGLCYGAQLMMHVLGGEVKKADVREYGKTEVIIDKTSSKIFADVSTPTICWMSHIDYIAKRLRDL